MEPNQVVETDWAAIERVLPRDYAELAQAMRVIREQPPQLHTKIHDASTLLRLLLLHVGLHFSVVLTAAVAKAAGLADVSGVAVHKRMRTSGPYLAALVARLLDLPHQASRLLHGTFRLRVLDATVLTRPGASGTSARVHYDLGLPDLELLHLEVTDEHEGELVRRFPVQPGDLLLLDRGYANPPGVAFAVDRGGDVVVRVNRKNLPLVDPKGVPIDLEACLDAVDRAHQSKAWPVWVPVGDRHHRKAGPTRYLEGRLCIKKLSASKAAQARADLRRDRDVEVTEEALRCAGYLILFTTVPKEKLPLKEVFQVYRLRWQVELRIKRDKSIGGLDELPNQLPETIYSWLVLEMLIQVLAERLATRPGAFPPGGGMGGAGVEADAGDERGPASCLAPDAVGGPAARPA